MVDNVDVFCWLFVVVNGTVEVFEVNDEKNADVILLVEVVGVVNAVFGVFLDVIVVVGVVVVGIFDVILSGVADVIVYDVVEDDDDHNNVLFRIQSA